MIYIIDANNLAGMMGLLGQENFDRKLIGIVEHYFASKKINVFLVFDGRDNMGDKMKRGFLTVVYTPKDSYYKSADDKIVELAVDFKTRFKDEITIITDDRGLIDAIEIKIGDDNRFKFIKASDFAGKLRDKYTARISDAAPGSGEDEDEKNIGDENVKKINDEMLKIWTNQKTG